MVTDLDSASLYSSRSRFESDNEYYDEIGSNYQTARLYEPRLEITRSEIVAERLVAKLIYYQPSSQPDNNVEQVSSSVCLEGTANICNSLEDRSDFTEVKRQETIEPSVNGEAEEISTDLTQEPDIIDSIVEMVDSMSSSIRSSRTKSTDPLPGSDLDISTKYNLDASAVSLLYTFTPSVDSDNNEDEASLKDTLTLEYQNKSICFLENEMRKCENEENNVHENTDDEFIWCDLLFDTEDDDEDSVTHSNNGSDILELPAGTVHELRQSNDECFRNGICDSVNEIIAELNVNDVRVTISCLINEIFQRVYDTISLVQLNTKYSSFASVKSSSFSILNSTENDNARNLEKEIYEVSKTAPLLVINEVIHHVIDACDNTESTVYQNNKEDMRSPSKKAKNTVNAELKGTERNCAIFDKKRVEWCNSTIIIDNESNEEESCRIVRPLSTKKDDTTKADAVFEFCTIVKKSETIANNQAFELNFRVEKNDNERTDKYNTEQDTYSINSFEEISSLSTIEEVEFDDAVVNLHND